jgi:hypothetical protein
MSNNFYVYLLLDPRNFYLPFYVGKGLGNRAYGSANNSRHNRFKAAVIEKILANGLIPKVMIWKSNLDELEAFDLERDLIARFGRRDLCEYGLLTNLTNGGEGLSGHIFTEEHKAKIAAAHKGRVVSEETRAKLSKARRGKRASTETRKKLSALRKGKGSGEANPMFGRKGELNPKFGKPGLSGSENGMFGKRHSEDALRKMSEAAQKRPRISGSASKSCDPTVFVFSNEDVTITGTVVQFCEATGLCLHQVGNLKRGKQKTCKGWSIARKADQ